jgi:DnaJ-class molecular chaperone
MKDIYKELNITKDTPKAEIKKQYRKFSKENHPDIGGDSEKFQEYQEMYSIVLSDKKREQYERTGRVEPDNEKASIIRTVIMLMEKMIQEDPCNVEEALKEEESMAKNAHENERRNIRATIGKYDIMKERMSLKKGTVNILGGHIDDCIDDCNKKLEKISAQMDRNVNVFKYIREHYLFVSREEEEEQWSTFAWKS